jgi:hypothetical protein
LGVVIVDGVMGVLSVMGDMGVAGVVGVVGLWRIVSVVMVFLKQGQSFVDTSFFLNKLPIYQSLYNNLSHLNQ